jgi:hypothetical protein
MRHLVLNDKQPGRSLLPISGKIRIGFLRPNILVRPTGQDKFWNGQAEAGELDRVQAKRIKLPGMRKNCGSDPFRREANQAGRKCPRSRETEQNHRSRIQLRMVSLRGKLIESGK